MTNHVIPTDLCELARHRVEIEYVERQEQTAHNVAQVREEATVRGALQSSGAILMVRRVLEREYDVRVHIAWQVWARAFNAKGVLITSDLSTTLKQEVARHSVEGCQDLRDHYERAITTGRGLGSFSLSQMDDARQRAVDKVASEIDFAVLEASRPVTAAGAESTPTFNISNVGAIQTGPGATATIHMGLDDVAKQALVDAFRAVSKGLAESAQVSSEVRAELIEVVAEAQAEVAKPRPNVTKLQGAISTVGTTVRTIGSLPGAYAALKAAGSLIGIALP